MQQQTTIDDKRADHEPALSSLREMLRLPGFTADSLYALAFNCLTAGQIRRAEQFFLMLCLLESKAAHGFLGYGICLAERGEMDLAAHLFQLALQRAPSWPVPHAHLARVHIARAEFSAAREALDRFFALRDDSVPAQLAEDATRMRQFLAEQEEGATVNG